MLFDVIRRPLQAVHLAKPVEYWDEGMGNKWEQHGERGKCVKNVSKGKILRRGWGEEAQGVGG